MEIAQSAGATLSHYPHPSAEGRFGEALSIDVAHLGNRSADRQLLVISGTHGQEGYAGSAAQVGWLLSSESEIALTDVGVLLVHGLNPYGFSHGSRTTENNVDLNRNFVDHTRPYPENPGYEKLHHALTPAVWSRDSFDSVSGAEAEFIETEGVDALFNALVAGQYSHPDGLMFGGNRREWSNFMLERILGDHIGGASKVAFIEWHTGIGDYGKPFFLSFNDPQSEEMRQAALWWGPDVANARPHGMTRPAYRGLVFYGVQAFLPNARVAGAVIEFGTRGPEAGAVAMRQDRWLRFHGEAVSTEMQTLLWADLRDSLNPASYLWRQAVVDHGVVLTRAALCGLARW
ncbi:hypothetical protein PAMC26510_31200 [Caballeronia sordidicola]|uniref:Deacylase n=1 Tax=Caballeronia sordidicola TaxID=196367 RepID=A0A242M8B2_CABSO|nr:hypothetical protein PAMC26510_31200 [Caballeronia sordidicola]